MQKYYSNKRADAKQADNNYNHGQAKNKSNGKGSKSSKYSFYKDIYKVNNLNSNFCTLTLDSLKKNQKNKSNNNMSYIIGKPNMAKVPSEQIQISCNMLGSKLVENSKSSKHISTSKDKKGNMESKYSHNANQLHVTQLSESSDTKNGTYVQKFCKNIKPTIKDKEEKFQQNSKLHMRTKTFDKNDSKKNSKASHHLNPTKIQNKINLKKNIKIKQDFLSNITKTFDKRLLYYSKKEIANSQSSLVAFKEKENATKKQEKITEKVNNKKKINENIISLK